MFPKRADYESVDVNTKKQKTKNKKTKIKNGITFSLYSRMDTLYLVVGNDYEWEDMKMFDNEQYAIEYSKKYPQIRIEIFKKNEKGTFLLPTYAHYQNGTLVKK